MSLVRNFPVAFAPRFTLHTARIVMAAVLLASVGLTALIVTPVRAAGPTVVWDESRFVTLSSNNISDIAMANDFLLRGARSLSGFSAWLSDNVADDDGVLDSFSGTLGWAIYSNNAGQPGTLLNNGQDATPTLTDTGVQDASGCDIVRVDVGFPSAVSLPAGRYWLALHEGNWGSASDGSIVWWQYANQVDFNQMYFVGSWNPTGAAVDNAFVLRGTSVWDQSAFVTLSSNNISDIVMANDFLLPASGSLNGFSAWLSDNVADDDGVLDSFSGTLGWAVYSNIAGQPGTLLNNGQDATPTLTDTGVQDASGCDIVRVDVGFPSAVSLPAGRYWLALHEGNWGSASDGSIVWWQYANQVDFNQMYFVGSWNPTGAAMDNAFVVWEDFSNRSISKSDGVTSVTPGSTVTYTITVSNAGPVTEPSGTVVDNFTSALTSCATTSTAAGGASGNDPGPTPGNINDSGLVLPAGSSVTYTSVCSIDPAATGMLTNTATVTGANADLSPANDTAIDSDTLNPSADVSITKTDGASAEVPGTNITYTIIASNATGPSLASGVTVSDTFPAALNACTWSSTAAGGATGNTGTGSGNINETGIALPVGASVTYTINCTIDPSATGSLENTATITSAAADPVPENNSATDTDTLDPSADISITKTDGASAEVPGTDVTYTITASNATGPSLATGVTVSDTFPAALNACTWSSTAAGGATGNAGTGSGNINETGIALPVGASVTYTVSCNIDPAATGSLENTATITSAAADPVPGNNSATDTDTLEPSADLSITKTDGASAAVPGTDVTYTIVASNATGPSLATGVTVSDTFPAALNACTWSSTAAGGATGNAGTGSGNINETGIALPVGASVTYTINCTIDPSATGSLENTATITSAAADPVPENNSATDTDTLDPSADISITKTDGSASAALGATVTYTIVASNAGPSTPTDVTVIDNFPAILTNCSTTSVANGGATGNDPGPILGNLTDGGINLPPGADVTYTTSCTVDAGATGTIDNTATITSAMTDPDPENNSAMDTDTIQWIDLAITKSGGGAHVPLGGTASYTLTYSNNGLQGATGVTLTDTVPAYTTFYAAGSTAGWVCLPDNNAGSTCTLDVGAVAGSSSGSTTFAVTVTSPLPPDTTQLSNTASIADDGTNGTDPVPGNNSSTDATVTYDNMPPTISATSLQLFYLDMGPASFTITFSEDVSNLGGGVGIDDATNPRNYLLLRPGPNAAYDTTSCQAFATNGNLPLGDDIHIPTGPVSYTNSGGFEATITLNGGTSLPIGVYRLLVCGTTSIIDLAGNPLNGGADSVMNFTVTETPAEVPATGFAPNRVTALPQQTNSYTQSDLWLEIPILGVKMDIVGVPQSEDGTWDVPWLGSNAGWLNGTAYPTWNGNSVLTAHVVDANGKAGPFSYINTLLYGDKVIVHAGGAEYVYEVRSVTQVTPSSTAQMLKHEELPWVTLVTCRGYDLVTGEYRYRILVRAVLVSVK